MFWALVWGMGACLPMALLSVILFNSLSGLNPRYWLLSIASAFLPYLGLLVFLAVIAGAVTLLGVIARRSILGLLFCAVVVQYTAMIAAHVLGRFYFRFEKRIGWGI